MESNGQANPDVAAPKLSCASCGKLGVSICAKCAKRGYTRAVARANPLEKRDPNLFKRLDDLSRLPLQDNKPVWDEFCAELGAERYYEHLPVLEEIVQEGKWRSEAPYPKLWLRGALARRVNRIYGKEEYGPDGRRRPSHPKYDKRSGALVTPDIRPFTEFALVNDKWDTMPPDEVIDAEIAKRDLQEDEGQVSLVAPADRESLKALGRMTVAERIEHWDCEMYARQLTEYPDLFALNLKTAISSQRELAARLQLDSDEAEVIAVISMLWAVGPRTYLNHLENEKKKRIRNAWDRLDRRTKNPKLAPMFRQMLRTSAHMRRAEWARTRREYDEARLRREEARTRTLKSHLRSPRNAPGVARVVVRTGFGATVWPAH